MALSGFIKQLLETDSVFGSEAKKLTGINDGVNVSLVKVATKGILGTSVDITPSAPDKIRFTFKNIPDSARSFNNEFVPNSLVRITLSDIDASSNQQVIETEKYNKRLYILNSINIETPNTFIVDLTIEPANDPFFSQLNPVVDVDINEALFDPRIASIIDNPAISKPSENGSTMFNLDNTSSGNVGDGPSGIARKYAAHYHGARQINITSHSKDDRNNPLIRYTVDTTQIDGIKTEFVFLEDLVEGYIRDRQFNQLIPPGTAPGVKVDYDNGTVSDTVAEYGDIGSIGLGEITLNHYPVEQDRPALNFGTSVTLILLVDNTTIPYSFIFGLAAADETDTTKIWPLPPAGLETVGGAMLTLSAAMNTWIGLNGLFIQNEFSFINPDPVTATPNRITIIAAPKAINNVDVRVFNGSGAPADEISKENVTGATDRVPSTGIKFTTQAELLTVLQNNVDPRFDITAAPISNRIILSTDTDPIKTVSFGEPNPPAIRDVWNDEAGNNIISGVVSKAAIMQITINDPAQIVFDNKGNVVYSRDIPDDC